MDAFRSRHVTLSYPGDAYFVYESWPISDQTKMTCFIFVYKNSSVQFVAVKIVSAVVAYFNYKKSAIYTAGNKQQHFNRAFEGLNHEGSHTTVFRAWNNVSTSLHDPATHRQSIWEARIKMILLYHVLYTVSCTTCSRFHGRYGSFHEKNINASFDGNFRESFHGSSFHASFHATFNGSSGSFHGRDFHWSFHWSFYGSFSLRKLPCK